MCIVVDTNTFSCVFNQKNKEHFKYSPVYDWIINKEGSLVYGGSTLISEFRGNKLNLIKLLSDKNKTVRIDSKLVDKKEEQVKMIVDDDEDFDDPHIIALLQVSKCKLICTHDKRLDSFIKDQRFFKKRTIQPRIYRNKKNEHLLCRQNIGTCCDQNNKLNKNELDELVKLLNQ